MPPGATPLVSLGKQSSVGMPKQQAGSSSAPPAEAREGAKNAELASSPRSSSEEKKTGGFDAEIERLIDEADEEMRDGESEEDEDPIANMLDGEAEGTTATEAKPPGEVNAEAAKREPAAPIAARPEGTRAFFRDAVKCASAGLVTPAMVGADDFPQSVPEGGAAPRWCPHLWAGLPPLLDPFGKPLRGYGYGPPCPGARRFVAVYAKQFPKGGLPLTWRANPSRVGWA